MLTEKNEIYIANNWDSYQQPVHGANYHADTLRLLAALDEGWQIMESASFLAQGNNNEGRGYLLTLFHPMRCITCQWKVALSESMKNLLALESVPGYIN